MSSTKFDNSSYWKLLQVAFQAKLGLMTIAEKYNLTVMQLYTLCLLDTGASIPMNSLSSKLHCDASNVTGIVDRLFSQYLIKREENPQDRREKMITITPNGAKLCIKISQEINKYAPEGFKNLTADEKKQFHILLTKLLQTPWA